MEMVTTELLLQHVSLCAPPGACTDFLKGFVLTHNSIHVFFFYTIFFSIKMHELFPEK